MSDYRVPPDGPDYHVPSAVTSLTDACPQCGSHAIAPTREVLTRGMPRQMQVFECARCGTLYRIRPELPTWRDLGRDAAVVACVLIVLVLAAILLI
jgi:hypothetical protein